MRSDVVHVHDAEGRRLHARHLDAADGHVRLLLAVLPQHHLVVHLVDVVAGQDDDVARRVVLDDVDVLEHRVGGAGVPGGLGDALARRQDVEALVALGAEEGPAALEVADQAVRLVLRGDADALDARVERVGQGEVDDARLAAEVDRGLGPDVGHLHQAAAAAARQHIGHGRARERGDAGVAPLGHASSSPSGRARARRCRSAAAKHPPRERARSRRRIPRPCGPTRTSRRPRCSAPPPATSARAPATARPPPPVAGSSRRNRPPP